MSPWREPSEVLKQLSGPADVVSVDDDPAFDLVLAAARTGQPWACRRLWEMLSRPVFGFARLHGAAEPDDVTSEVFLQVFRDLDRFVGDEVAFRAWVFTIARRRVIDAARRRRRRPATTSWSEGVDVVGGDVEDDAAAAWAEQLGDLRGVLDVLTRSQREVVLLRIVADLSLEDVARATGRSVGSVKSLQHRALAALREVLLARRAPWGGSDAIWVTR